MPKERKIMNEKYMNIFPDMFFDINANEAIENVLAQTSELFSTLIYKLGEVSNELNYSIEVNQDDSYLHLVITLFVRKLMEQVDAINILYFHGSITEAELILRSMFETVIALKFILLKDDTDREETRFRAAAYFMGHQYQEMSIADKQMQQGGLIDGKMLFED